MQYGLGSDVEAVLASAKRLDTDAAEVAGVTSAVGAATTRTSAAWGGSDASAFAGASVSTAAGAGGTASAQPNSSYNPGLHGQAGRPEDKELCKLAYNSYDGHAKDGSEKPPVPPGFTKVAPEQSGLDPGSSTIP